VRKYIESAFMAAIVYCISIMIGFILYNSIYNLPFDRNREVSGGFIGSFVTVIPYVLLGLFISFRHKNQTLQNATLIGLFVVIGERLSLYLIGWNYVRTGIDGWNYESFRSPIQFVWAEALPYFTLFYIFYGGILSLLLCVITAMFGQKIRKRASSS
jgi:hypothetical protein